MKIIETPLSGSFLIELEPFHDERGFFARAFSPREFHQCGLQGNLTEISISRNLAKGTLRGMHFQKEPHGETKLVRVARGRAFDVIVDIRKDSATFGQWYGQELSAEKGNALYVPSGFAHGFLTLEKQTDVFYQITDTFHAEASDGIAWDDPKIGIEWPSFPRVISRADGNRMPLRSI